MAVYVALLRGINVGGHRSVAMVDLRDLLVGLGFAGVRSLLQSGNLVFRGPPRSPDRLERTLELEAAKRLGLRTDFFVRTATEWKSVLARNPFPAEAERDPGHLIVMFLKKAPGAKSVRALRAAITGREVVQPRGREAYIVYPDGMGRSRLTNASIDKALGTSGTGRNWNTVRKVAALTEG
jgi:uncharacterized protein (DUF1697 family)